MSYDRSIWSGYNNYQDEETKSNVEECPSKHNEYSQLPSISCPDQQEPDSKKLEKYIQLLQKMMQPLSQ